VEKRLGRSVVSSEKAIDYIQSPEELPFEAHESLLEEIPRGIFVSNTLQLHRESHINDMVVICPAVIFAGVIVIGLTDILRRERQVVEQLDVETGIPADLLKPSEAVPGEVAPVWFYGKMD
jgi:hypothetical protein